MKTSAPHHQDCPTVLWKDLFQYEGEKGSCCDIVDLRYVFSLLKDENVLSAVAVVTPMVIAI